MVIENRYMFSICYNFDNLWLHEGSYDEDGNFKRLRTYVCYKDGSSIIVLDDADIMTTEDGIVYKQDGDTLVICGYEGDEYIVEIPYEIDGIFVTDIETDNLPSGHEYYLAATEEDFEYSTGDGDGIIITKYTGTMTKFIIPDKLDGKSVVEIGENAFAESEIVDVVISGNIKKIDGYAFSDCAKLEKVYFKEGLEELGEYAFSGASALTEVDLPESLLILGNACFAGTKLTSIYIPKNVENIYNTALTLTAIENIEVDPDNVTFASVDGVLYTKDLTSLITVPCARAGSFVVPASVTLIGGGAFFDCNNITEVSLEVGSKLENVSKLAFIDCNSLSVVDFSNGGINIEAGAFYQCGNISEVYFSPATTSLPAELFYENAIPDTLTKVRYRSDCDCQVVWPESVTVETYDAE